MLVFLQQFASWQALCLSNLSLVVQIYSFHLTASKLQFRLCNFKLTGAGYARTARPREPAAPGHLHAGRDRDDRALVAVQDAGRRRRRQRAAALGGAEKVCPEHSNRQSFGAKFLNSYNPNILNSQGYHCAGSWVWFSSHQNRECWLNLQAPQGRMPQDCTPTQQPGGRQRNSGAPHATDTRTGAVWQWRGNGRLGIL